MKENENLIFLSIRILSIMKSIDTLFLSYNFQCQILKKINIYLQIKNNININTSKITKHVKIFR